MLHNEVQTVILDFLVSEKFPVGGFDLFRCFLCFDPFDILIMVLDSLLILGFEIFAAFQGVKFLLKILCLVRFLLGIGKIFFRFVPLCFEGIGNTGVLLNNG